MDSPRREVLLLTGGLLGAGALALAVGFGQQPREGTQPRSEDARDDGSDDDDGDDSGDENDEGDENENADVDDGEAGSDGDDTDDESNGSAPTELSIGDRVAPTTESAVTADPDPGSTETGEVYPERRGFVDDGPESFDGEAWWRVEFEDRPTGWLPEPTLTHAPIAREPLPFDVLTNLNDPIDVTGEAIDAAIAAERPDSPMIGLGETFVAVQGEFYVDALYQTAHAVHESAWGESAIAQDHNNLFGWGAEDDDPYGKAAQFDSFEECIWEVMEQVKELYLTPGDWRYHGPHLEGMNEFYATDPEWDVKIVAHYETLAGHL